MREFATTRRARLTPEQVGLPPTRSRRVPKRLYTAGRLRLLASGQRPPTLLPSTAHDSEGT